MEKKLIVRHRELSAQIMSLQNELAEIEQSAAYAKELQWAKDLENLMTTYGKSASDVAHLLGNASNARKGTRGPKTGTPRKRISYKNPHTGEQIHTASGNNRILKEWKKKYPNDDIKSWII